MLLAIVACCPILIMSCSSPPDPEALPQESQSGQNIIACRIDGKVWQPRIDFFKNFKGGGTGSIARYSAKSKTLFFGGQNDDDGRTIGVSLANCSQEGTYFLDSQSIDVLRPTNNSGYFSPSVYISENTYWTTTQYTGQVVITKLRDRIVSGRFAFTALNQKTGKTIHVTDGRFDFFYAPGIND